MLAYFGLFAPVRLRKVVPGDVGLSVGSPIIEGLAGSNTAYVLQGTVLVGALAIATDRLFAALETRLRRRLALG